MTWQEEDADANRQGLTIAEMEELGGPGMGGCPAGPTEQSAPLPGGAFAVRSTDKTSAEGQLGARDPAAGCRRGHRLQRRGDRCDHEHHRPAGRGRRPGRRRRSKGATLTGLKATESYTVEVRSLTGAKLSEPFTVSPGTGPAATGRRHLPPAVTATPAPNPDPHAAVTRRRSR